MRGETKLSEIYFAIKFCPGTEPLKDLLLWLSLFNGFIQIVWENESGCSLSKTADLLRRAIIDGTLSG